MTASTGLCSALFERLKRGEPVGRRRDDIGRGASRECRRRRKERDEVVRDKVAVGMRDLEHARAWHGAVNDSGDVNVKRSEPFGTRIKQAICCQNINELERVMRANEAVFSLESDCDGGHSSIGVGALLILLMCDALHGCRRLMTGLWFVKGVS